MGVGAEGLGFPSPVGRVAGALRNAKAFRYRSKRLLLPLALGRLRHAEFFPAGLDRLLSRVEDGDHV